MSSILTQLSSEQLSSTPNTPPPDGTQSNFGDAENNSTPLYVVCSLFLAIMLCFFVNRIYTKIYIVRKYSWDDVTITFAVLGSILMFVASVWGGRRGRMGNHAWDINLAQTFNKDFLIPIWFLSWWPSFVYLFLKDSFFIMYLDIFKPLRWMRICAYTAAAITTTFYTSMSVAALIFTTPRRGETWREHLFSKDGLLAATLPVPTSSFGVAIDLVILILPIIAVMPLQLPTRRKIGVVCVFMTGLLACVFSMLNIHFRLILRDDFNDTTWNDATADIVTLLEMFVGIICACTPAAARSYDHHLKSLSALKMIFISQLSRVGLSTKRSKASLLAREGDHQPGQYSNIDIYEGSGRSGPMGKAQSNIVRTFIHKGKQQDLENDGIHLTFEMHDQVSQERLPGHKAATSLEQVDTNYDGLRIEQYPT